MKHYIYRYLQSADKPVKRLELLQAMRVTMSDQTLKDRKLRKTVEEMITQDGFLIRSSELGYSIIKTEEDLTDAMEYLKSKAFPIFERAKCLQNSFYKNKEKQLSFEGFCLP
jgi:hypothetical protein